MININIDDFEVQELFHHLEYQAEHLDDAMNEIGQLMVDSVRANFEAGGRPEAWEPRLVDVPWPILRKTGNLYNSIHYSVYGDNVDIDDDTEYGRYHDQGTSRLPARPFLLIQDEDEQRIMDLIAQHFD